MALYVYTHTCFVCGGSEKKKRLPSENASECEKTAVLDEFFRLLVIDFLNQISSDRRARRRKNIEDPTNRGTTHLLIVKSLSLNQGSKKNELC